MNIKSLLLGSAAALAVVSGAQAADAIVAAEPEPMEYVKVCDAFGAGYFYIPGTETCLKIGGYVRIQEQFSSEDTATTDSYSDGYARGYLSFLTAQDTEAGVLKTNISFYVAGTDTGSDGATLDRAYIMLGGFGVGYTTNPFDDGIAGETDMLGDDTVNWRAWYEFSTGAFAGNIGFDQFGDLADSAAYGVSGKVGGTFGVVTATLYAGYDADSSEVAVEGVLSAAIGPGTLDFAGAYQSGDTRYFFSDEGETWALSAAYAAKITDKLTLTPGVQYTSFEDSGEDRWDAGLLAEYTITDGLVGSVNVQYNDPSDEDSYWDGWVRLQRNF
ncbi:porin [Rhizobium sp. PAMB 3182]